MPKLPKWARAYRDIEEAFKKVGKALSEIGLHGDGRIKHNTNGTVDAELRIRVGQGKKFGVRRTFVEIESLLQKHKEVKEKGFWLSSGIRYRPREDEPFYRKFQGMSQVEVFPQRANKMAYNFVTVRESVVKAMSKKGRKVAEQIFVRLHWNPKDKKPKRK